MPRRAYCQAPVAGPEGARLGLSGGVKRTGQAIACVKAWEAGGQHPIPVESIGQLGTYGCACGWGTSAQTPASWLAGLAPQRPIPLKAGPHCTSSGLAPSQPDYWQPPGPPYPTSKFKSQRPSVTQPLPTSLGSLVPSLLSLHCLPSIAHTSPPPGLCPPCFLCLEYSLAASAGLK